jgi:hypothetical protein
MKGHMTTQEDLATDVFSLTILNKSLLVRMYVFHLV